MFDGLGFGGLARTGDWRAKKFARDKQRGHVRTERCGNPLSSQSLSKRLPALDIIAMEVDPTSPMSPYPYTILRIKRKRNEEPLDALGKPFSVIAHRRGMKEKA